MMKLYENEVNSIAKQNDIPWEKLSGKTILLSGATGMVGKCLIDILMRRNAMSENSMGMEPIKIIALSRKKETAKERLGSIGRRRVFGIFLRM